VRLFCRDPGVDTAYVGNSNLSQAAPLDGPKRNVRLSSVGTPALLHKFEVTFDDYWAQSAFQRDTCNGDKLDAALEHNGGPHTGIHKAVQPSSDRRGGRAIVNEGFHKFGPDVGAFQ
jgi:hypothetical protein